MSFGLPAVKVKPELEEKGFKVSQGTFGVPNPFVAGLGDSRPKLGYSHPLEASEKNYLQNEEKMNMAMLRNIQGLHAPLKLSMEKKFCSQIGHLPFLPRSNFQADVISGRYLEIGFEDFLNLREFCEISGHPHAVMERTLGLL